jgi:sialate O-acetylesterase
MNDTSKMKKRVWIWMLNMAICLVAQAKELRVAGIFSNDMVLQRECSVPVWGKAQAGKEVVITTSWNDSCYKVSPAPDGNWKVNILTPKASATAYEIRIVCGKEAIVLNNVLIGDVWLCSGQSNMSMPLKGYYCQPVCGSNEAILNSVGSKFVLST